MAVSNALELLVQASPRELHHKQADGTRVVDRLYEACCTSGLVPPQPAAASSTKGAVEHRYCAIFDAALNNGLGCWLIDYVELVVADKHLSSSDSVDAYLLDGEFVKAWCSQHLDQAEATLSQALASDASLAQFAAAAAAQLSRVNALVRILQALQQLRKRDAAMAQAGPIAGRLARSSERLSVKAELRQAVLLQQCCQVLDWCARHRLLRGPAGSAAGASIGRHSSYAEWMRSVQARRARAAPRTLFGDSLLAALSIPGHYPWASLHAALHALLLGVQDASSGALHSKLALLLYYCMDVGLLHGQAQGSMQAAGSRPGAADASVKALDDLRSVFGLSAAVLGQWQAMFWLDCADVSGGRTDPQLACACELLPSCATPNMPFDLLHALLALGEPHVALQLYRAQACAGGGVVGVQSGARPLEQAAVLLDIQLRCGLMAEAFCFMHAHCTSLPLEQQVTATRVLLPRLLQWAYDHNSAAAPHLHKLLELPFGQQEEAVVVEWLSVQAAAGSPAGQHLPLYFLQRGRALEGLAAWRRLNGMQAVLAAAGHAPTPSSSGNEELSVNDLVQTAVDAAFYLLPAPLRNVHVPGDMAVPLDQVLASSSTQGAAGVLRGLLVQDGPSIPLVELPFRGEEVPPLLGSCARPVQAMMEESASVQLDTDQATAALGNAPSTNAAATSTSASGREADAAAGTAGSAFTDTTQGGRRGAAPAATSLLGASLFRTNAEDPSTFSTLQGPPAGSSMFGSLAGMGGAAGGGGAFAQGFGFGGGFGGSQLMGGALAMGAEGGGFFGAVGAMAGAGLFGAGPSAAALPSVGLGTPGPTLFALPGAAAAKRPRPDGAAPMQWGVGQ